MLEGNEEVVQHQLRAGNISLGRPAGQCAKEQKKVRRKKEKERRKKEKERRRGKRGRERNTSDIILHVLREIFEDESLTCGCVTKSPILTPLFLGLGYVVSEF